MLWNNGAVGYRTAMPFDCLGPYAKVQNCPVMVDDKEVARHTCYATGYADSFSSIPACTRHYNKHIRGYFTHNGEEGVVFHVMDSHKHLFEQGRIVSEDSAIHPTSTLSG